MNRRRAISVILTLAGLALFVWMIRDAGLDDVASGLGSVGWGFAAILLLSLVRFALRAAAWRLLLPSPVPLSSALSASLIGDALGNATPFGLAASEPAKAAFLTRQTGTADALAALTVENFFYSVSVALYVGAGAIVLLTVFTLPDELRWSGLISLVAMVAVLAGAAWIAWFKPTAASALLFRIPSRRARVLVAKLYDFEQRLYGSVSRPGVRLGRVALAETGFHVSSFLESWLTIWLLTGASAPLAAFILDSVNRVINVVFKNIPFRTGVDEYAGEVIAGAIGLAPNTGLLLALVRKARLIFWAGIAMGLWIKSKDK
jgi:hypothetical protein